MEQRIYGQYTYVAPERTLLGVYAATRMVGFAMYGLNPDDGTVNFLHFITERGRSA